jgi:hypothetical protein
LFRRVRLSVGIEHGIEHWQAEPDDGTGAGGAQEKSAS